MESRQIVLLDARLIRGQHNVGPQGCHIKPEKVSVDEALYYRRSFTDVYEYGFKGVLRDDLTLASVHVATALGPALIVPLCRGFVRFLSRIASIAGDQ